MELAQGSMTGAALYAQTDGTRGSSVGLSLLASVFTHASFICFEGLKACRHVPHVLLGTARVIKRTSYSQLAHLPSELSLTHKL